VICRRVAVRRIGLNHPVYIDQSTNVSANTLHQWGCPCVQVCFYPITVTDPHAFCVLIETMCTFVVAGLEGIMRTVRVRQEPFLCAFDGMFEKKMPRKAIVGAAPTKWASLVTLELTAKGHSEWKHLVAQTSRCSLSSTVD